MEKKTLKLKVICFGIYTSGKRKQKTLNLDIPERYVQLHPQHTDNELRWSYFNSFSRFQWEHFLGWTTIWFKYAKCVLSEQEINSETK